MKDGIWLGSLGFLLESRESQREWGKLHVYLKLSISINHEYRQQSTVVLAVPGNLSLIRSWGISIEHYGHYSHLYVAFMLQTIVFFRPAATSWL